MFYIITIFSTLLLVLIDFVSKRAVMHYMELYQTIKVIPDVLHFYYIRNPGVGLGMLEHQRWLFIPVTVLVTIVCVVVLYRSPLRKQPLFSSICVLIISGAIGNLIDRIFYGEVVDFLLIQFIYFPYTFNIADCYVVVAFTALVILMLFNQKKFEDMPLRTLLFNIPKNVKGKNDGR